MESLPEIHKTLKSEFTAVADPQFPRGLAPTSQDNILASLSGKLHENEEKLDLWVERDASLAFPSLLSLGSTTVQGGVMTR